MQCCYWTVLTIHIDYSNTWFLGMNLNPSDGHIMSYETGWDDGNDIGHKATALTKDYLSSTVWNMPVNRIAIVRHQKVSLGPRLIVKLKLIAFCLVLLTE